MDKKSVGTGLHWSYSLRHWRFVGRAEVSQPCTCVNRRTPHSLWSRRKSHTTQPASAVERFPSQVACWPCWLLVGHGQSGWSFCHLPPSCAINLWSASELQRVPGPSSAADLASVVWPETLKRLVFVLNIPVNTVSWPASLQQVSFGD